MPQKHTAVRVRSSMKPELRSSGNHPRQPGEGRQPSSMKPELRSSGNYLPWLARYALNAPQ